MGGRIELTNQGRFLRLLPSWCDSSSSFDVFSSCFWLNRGFKTLTLLVFCLSSNHSLLKEGDHLALCTSFDTLSQDEIDRGVAIGSPR